MAVLKGRSRRLPWSYRAGTSLLHRWPAGIKLLCLLVVSASPVWGLPAMGGAAAALLAGSLFSGIRPWELLAGSRPLMVMLTAITVFKSVQISFPPSFDHNGLSGSLIFAGGILISFAGGALFFSVTTMTTIRRSLEKAELFVLRPFRKKRRHGTPASNHGILSLALALMLGFLPRFFELWEASELACRARFCRGGLGRTILVLPLVTERMIKMAAETAIALESRGLLL